MFRLALRTFKTGVRSIERHSTSSIARIGVSPVLPRSTVVASLVGICSAVYAYELGIWNGRAAGSTQNESPSKSKYGGPEEVQQVIKELHAALPNQVRVDHPTVETYGFSPHTYLPSSPHAVYVAATSTEDVIKVVNISRKHKVPIVPFGVGNSLEGHFAGVSHFIVQPSVDQALIFANSIQQEVYASICQGWTKFSRSTVRDSRQRLPWVGLRAIIEEDGDLICQAGTSWDEINRILEEKGIPLFFPVCTNSRLVSQLEY